MKKAKKFFMNPWTITLGSGLFVLLITIAIDLITAEKIFSTIVTVLSSALDGILAFLNFKLKVWWVITGIAALVFALYLWSKYLDSKKIEQNDPAFLEYTKDYILNYNWKWRWEKNLYGKYEIENLHPICSECETPLTRANGYGQLHCLRCNMTFQQALPDDNEVKMLISDNANRGLFSNE